MTNLNSLLKNVFDNIETSSDLKTVTEFLDGQFGYDNKRRERFIEKRIFQMVSKFNVFNVEYETSDFAKVFEKCGSFDELEKHIQNHFQGKTSDDRIVELLKEFIVVPFWQFGNKGKKQALLDEKTGKGFTALNWSMESHWGSTIDVTKNIKIKGYGAGGFFFKSHLWDELLVLLDIKDLKLANWRRDNVIEDGFKTLVGGEVVISHDKFVEAVNKSIVRVLWDKGSVLLKQR
jgi:hypothetical protein